MTPGYERDESAGSADSSAIDRLVSQSGINFPDDYLDLLRYRNGAEGFVGDTYVILWKAEELVEFNRQYEVEQRAPGIFLIGSNGGGEGFGFDTLSDALPIVRLPFVGMARHHAVPVANAQLFMRAPLPISKGRSEHHAGLELIEVTPLKLGGDPVDPANKAWATRQQHFKYVRYWNGVIKDLLAPTQ